MTGNFGDGRQPQMTKPRTIAAVALAAGTFGGTIGALATAAIQSQASPEAIAAAVQRVSDANAEQSLHGINAKLGTANTELATLNTNLNADLNALASYLGIASEPHTAERLFNAPR
jgi:hypothetical protein